MPQPHGTKTHEGAGGLYGAGHQSQILRLLSCSDCKNLATIHSSWQKLFSFCPKTDRHTFCIPIDIGNIFSALKCIPFHYNTFFIHSLCSLALFVKDKILNFDTTKGGSPGLVVIGGDSCSKGREFESWHRILDGHFSHLSEQNGVSSLRLLTPF